MTNEKKKAGRPVGSSTGGARALTDAEVKRLVAVAKGIGVRAYALVCFLLGTGCRVSEPLHLTLGQAAPNGKVQGSIALDKHKTKSGKSRRVFLSEDAQKALQKLVDVRLASGATEDQFVFVGRSGKALTANYVTTHVKKLMSEAGIADASSHSCRKTFATRLVNAGVAVSHIQKLMGHANLQNTMLYFSSTDTDLEKAVNVLSL